MPLQGPQGVRQETPRVHPVPALCTVLDHVLAQQHGILQASIAAVCTAVVAPQVSNKQLQVAYQVVLEGNCLKYL
jgi:hypothetical protein